MPRLDVRRLEALGFFRHVRAADLDRVLREADSPGRLFAEETRRSYHADARTWPRATCATSSARSRRSCGARAYDGTGTPAS